MVQLVSGCGPKIDGKVCEFLFLFLGLLSTVGQLKV